MPEVQVEDIEGPVDKGFCVPSVKSVKQIMEQWENGGKRFRPLKNWNDFNPSTFRSFKDVFKRKKVIADRFSQLGSKTEFDRHYPDQKSMVKLAKLIKSELRLRD
jgi:hypothetical protein